jgi:hypothetical protein
VVIRLTIHKNVETHGHANLVIELLFKTLDMKQKESEEFLDAPKPSKLNQGPTRLFQKHKPKKSSALIDDDSSDGAEVVTTFRKQGKDTTFPFFSVLVRLLIYVSRTFRGLGVPR